MKNLTHGDTPEIIAACKKHGLLRNQAAYVLATAYWETAATMKPVREYGGEKYLKSKKYYPYVGMGYVQLTWKANYEKASRKLGVDFVEKPKRLLEPEYAAEILVVGSKEGWFTGKKLSDYMTLNRSNYVGARRIINGTDKAHSIANLAKKYDKLLLADGYGVVNSKPLKKSRTVGGGTAAGAGGAAVIVKEVSDAVSEQQEALTSDSIVAVVIGAIILLGALTALYARWDDAGRPKPW